MERRGMSIIGTGEREYDRREPDQSAPVQHAIACSIREYLTPDYDHVVQLANDDGHGARVVVANDERPGVRYLIMVIEQDL
jgi:hypothetical protein